MRTIQILCIGLLVSAGLYSTKGSTYKSKENTNTTQFIVGDTTVPDGMTPTVPGTYDTTSPRIYDTAPGGTYDTTTPGGEGDTTPKQKRNKTRKRSTYPDRSITSPDRNFTIPGDGTGDRNPNKQ